MMWMTTLALLLPSVAQSEDVAIFEVGATTITVPGPLSPAEIALLEEIAEFQQIEQVVPGVPTGSEDPFEGFRKRCLEIGASNPDVDDGPGPDDATTHPGQTAGEKARNFAFWAIATGVFGMPARLLGTLDLGRGSNHGESPPPEPEEPEPASDDPPSDTELPPEGSLPAPAIDCGDLDDTARWYWVVLGAAGRMTALPCDDEVVNPGPDETDPIPQPANPLLACHGEPSNEEPGEFPGYDPGSPDGCDPQVAPCDDIRDILFQSGSDEGVVTLEQMEELQQLAEQFQCPPELCTSMD